LISEPKTAALLATIFVIFLKVEIIFCIKISKEHDTIKLMTSHAKNTQYRNTFWLRKLFGITNSGQGKESA